MVADVRRFEAAGLLRSTSGQHQDEIGAYTGHVLAPSAAAPEAGEHEACYPPPRGLPHRAGRRTRFQRARRHPETIICPSPETVPVGRRSPLTPGPVEVLHHRSSSEGESVIWVAATGQWVPVTAG